MSRLHNVIMTNICMIYRDDEVLVLDKIDDDKIVGITFPGGHIEKKESITDSVIREILEETGLTIYEPILCGIKDWVNDDGSRYLLFFYKTNKFEGEIKSSNEGKVFWTKRSELSKLKLAFDTDKMLEVMENDKLSEFFYYKENEEWKHIFM